MQAPSHLLHLDASREPFISQMSQTPDLGFISLTKSGPRHLPFPPSRAKRETYPLAMRTEREMSGWLIWTTERKGGIRPNLRRPCSSFVVPTCLAAVTAAALSVVRTQGSTTIRVAVRDAPSRTQCEPRRADRRRSDLAGTVAPVAIGGDRHASRAIGSLCRRRRATVATPIE